MLQTFLGMFQTAYSVIAMLMGMIGVTIALHQRIVAELLGKPLRINGVDGPIDWSGRGFLAFFALIFGCLGALGAWLFSNDWVSQSLSRFLAAVPIWAMAVLIPTFYLIITSYLNRSAGWSELRQNFSSPVGTSQFAKRLSWAVMGDNVSYKNIVTVSVHDTGLGIGISRFFGPFIGTVLVPWESVSAETAERSGSKLVKLLFHPLKKAPLTLPEEIWLEIELRRPIRTD